MLGRADSSYCITLLDMALCPPLQDKRAEVTPAYDLGEARHMACGDFLSHWSDKHFVVLSHSSMKVQRWPANRCACLRRRPLHRRMTQWGADGFTDSHGLHHLCSWCQSRSTFLICVCHQQWWIEDGFICHLDRLPGKGLPSNWKQKALA